MPASTNVKVSTLSYSILYVKDTEKTKLFYRDTLGLKIKQDHPGWVEFETGACTLALHGDEKLPANRATTGYPIMVFNVDDVYAAYEALKAKGVKFDGEPKQVCEEGDKIGKSADFKDPDGNPISIFGLVKK